MKCYVVKLPYGIICLNEKNEIVEKYFFENVEEAVESIFNNTIPDKLIKVLASKGLKIENKIPSEKFEFVREKFRELAREKYDEKELDEFLNSFSIELTKKRISSVSRRDKLIIQVVSAISDLDKILNTMSERLREWYGLHYPELEIDDNEKYAKNVAEKGRRENFKDFSFSIGMEFSDKDEKIIKEYAENLISMYSLRDKLEKYLKEIAEEEIPNLTALLGHILAARLLAAAGSLEKLAKMPSSTIQLLGAEKALFRFLRTKGKTKPPKHGIIFLSPYVANAPKDKRGKVSRILAAKLAVAARMDYYTKENKGEELRKDLEEKIKEVLK